MSASDRFESYIEHLAGGLGHADRRAGLEGYCTGLLLPLARKSVEPMAARIDPHHASARHQALHHFVAKADWSDAQMLRRVAQWVVPKMEVGAGACWIVDDTAVPKKGTHSVGVARQYCGVLGKQDNCQVAVSVSLATDLASLPVAWQLYLPRQWATDADRRKAAGVPPEVRFQTKPEIAIAQLAGLLAEGAPCHCVLADAGYGVDNAFRQALTDLGLPYVVGITSALVVWPPGIEPLPPRKYSGRGRPPVMPRRTVRRQPVSVKQLALDLPEAAFHTVTWRQGSNEPLTGRFAAVRVRHAGSNSGRARLRAQQWLLIEWPATDPEPMKYYLSTLPEDTPLEVLVAKAHMRWRIERDYQDLKQEVGLGHYEGRGWRGLHHHGVLSIAAYGFLVSERLAHGATDSAKKNSPICQAPAIPEGFVPRGSPAGQASRAGIDREPAATSRREAARKPRVLSVLPAKQNSKAKLMTQ
jgi:SRSO17 transposase